MLKEMETIINFATKCNNIPNTFSILITNNGAKFGFFKSIPINGDGPWREDNNAFFFSYD